jgi:UbiD family decarboxylase
LEVPASSEIVIEGFIHPHRRVQDGPFFDFTGKPNTNPTAYLFEATQLMFRNGAIFRGASIGNPGAEDHELFAFLAALNLVDFSGAELLKRRMFRAFQSLSKLQIM